MFIIKSPKAFQKRIHSLKAGGKTIAFVPTMGYLHEGHLSLVRRARKECDIVVASIFVNPSQFGPQEDLDKYPRDIRRDARLLKKEKVDYLFLPSIGSIYRKEHSIKISEGRMSNILCGKSRPGHFQGVLTIVAKLFNIISPHKAFFGQKDLQQAYLIQKMAAELDFPVKIMICPIIRERSGLAMSSRNTYLSEKNRKQALSLKASLDCIVDGFRSGIRNTRELKKEASKVLKKGSRRIDYLEIVELPDFSFPDKIEKRKKYAALCAAYIGRTRLIDNRLIKG